MAASRIVYLMVQLCPTAAATSDTAPPGVHVRQLITALCQTVVVTKSAATPGLVHTIALVTPDILLWVRTALQTHATSITVAAASYAAWTQRSQQYATAIQTITQTGLSANQSTTVKTAMVDAVVPVSLMAPVCPTALARASFQQ